MKTHALKTFCYTLFPKSSYIYPQGISKIKAELLKLWGGQQDLLNKVVNKGSGNISTKSASDTHCEPENCPFPLSVLVFLPVKWTSYLPFIVQRLWVCDCIWVCLQ